MHTATQAEATKTKTKTKLPVFCEAGCTVLLVLVLPTLHYANGKRHWVACSPALHTPVSPAHIHTHREREREMFSCVRGTHTHTPSHESRTQHTQEEGSQNQHKHAQTHIPDEGAVSLPNTRSISPRGTKERPCFRTMLLLNCTVLGMRSVSASHRNTFDHRSVGFW